MKKGQTTARTGLNLRAAPKTGPVIAALEFGAQVEVLSEETWLKVKTSSGVEGYVLSDYVELSSIKSPQLPVAASEAKIITYHPRSKYIQGKPARIDIGFLRVMKWIEKQLEALDLSMWITSSLREPGKPVSSAVVNPASLSNHLIGHAIDMNLFTETEWFNSSRLERIDINGASLSHPDEEKVRQFLSIIVNDSKAKFGFSLRWGGLFTPSDPVHIDDGTNINSNSQYWVALKQIWPSYFV